MTLHASVQKTVFVGNVHLPFPPGKFIIDLFPFSASQAEIT